MGYAIFSNHFCLYHNLNKIGKTFSKKLLLGSTILKLKLALIGRRLSWRYNIHLSKRYSTHIVRYIFESMLKLSLLFEFFPPTTQEM